jgi:hypothetical protein
VNTSIKSGKAKALNISAVSANTKLCGSKDKNISMKRIIALVDGNYQKPPKFNS